MKPDERKEISEEERIKALVEKEAKEVGGFDTGRPKAPKEVKHEYQFVINFADAAVDGKDLKFVYVGENDSKKCVTVGKYRIHTDTEYLYDNDAGPILHIWLDDFHLIIRNLEATPESRPLVVGDVILLAVRREERGTMSSGIIAFVNGSKTATYFNSDLPGNYILGEPSTIDNTTKIPLTMKLSMVRKPIQIGEVTLVMKSYV